MPVMASIEETTATALIERAIALRPLLVEQGAETERNRRYSEEIHRAFTDAGFYRSLIPKRYGGLELDMKSWLRLIAELAHGDIQARSSATATSARRPWQRRRARP
jgi:3-hydroxy-9,10-secoandrosta-1,3,5(10)-triene-9,17-dione monooxygenase